LLASLPEAHLAVEFQIARDTIVNLVGVRGELVEHVRGAQTRTLKVHQFL